MGSKIVAVCALHWDIPLELVREGWGMTPGQGDEPRGRGKQGGGILEMLGGWEEGGPQQGVGAGTVQLVLERRGRLSAALQKVPTWAPATRAGCGRGPAHSPAPARPAQHLQTRLNAHGIALADLRVSRSGSWQSPELAPLQMSKCHENYAI